VRLHRRVRRFTVAPPMGGDSYIGRYRIEEHIATGGMGEIYRATPADGIPKPVALKVIRPEVDADPSLRSMFEAEARVALALSHANVVQTFEVERNQGRLFLAMEHVDGLDLSKLLRTVTRALCQPLPWRHVLLIVCDALEGLDYAHRSRGADGCSLGIVHRDISPSNILVSCEGEVKIADFGVAVSTLRTHHSLVGTLKGKLVYMAPEQLRGESVDARADVYSMGAVLYEMLTGRRPFTDSGAAIIPDVLAGRFPRPREVRPDLPTALEEIVLTAMSTAREDRFRTAAALADWIREAAWELGYVLSNIDLGAFVRRVREEAPDSVPPPASSDTVTIADRERTVAARPSSLRPSPVP